jgi:hypothetical protein
MGTILRAPNDVVIQNIGRARKHSCEGKADVNAKDNSGHTPLAWAAHNGHEDVAELLREHDGKE